MSRQHAEQLGCHGARLFRALIVPPPAHCINEAGVRHRSPRRRCLGRARLLEPRNVLHEARHDREAAQRKCVAGIGAQRGAGVLCANHERADVA